MKSEHNPTQHARMIFGARILMSLALLLPLALSGCGLGEPAPTPTPLATSTPAPTATPVPPAAPAYWPTTGWQTSTPEEQGVDSQQLLAALQRIEDANYNVRSLMVIRNGFVVLDTYYQPFVPDTQIPVFSVTKSVIGSLVGIALHEGKIKSIQEPVLSFFPEKTIANRTPEKEGITVEDLLSMRPGLDCADEKIGFAVEQTKDWVQYILDMPMASPPGKNLVYCSAGVHLLSAILTKATGMSASAYAQSRLFTPLGIQAKDMSWSNDPQGITIGGYGITLRPQDMAKLGLLWLNGGKWGQQQVIPQEWVRTASQPHAFGVNNKDYGYNFWVYPQHFAAEGLGEQKIQVVKDRNMLVVFTSAIDWHKGSVLEPLLWDYIIPAVKSDKPLPANPAALSALQAKVKTIANPVQPVPPLSETARAISGKRFVLAKNEMGADAITLTFNEGSPEATGAVESGGQVTTSTIGLDNVYRMELPQNGVVTWLRGSWENNHTFVARELILPGIQEDEFRLDFSGDKLKMQVAEVILGSFKVDMEGTAP